MDYHQRQKIVHGRAFWGRPTWQFLHSVAATYKPEKAQEYVTFFKSLPFILPCEECGKNLTENFKSVPIEKYLGSNHTLFFWTYLIHDMVNQHHNKDHPDEPPKVSPDFETIKNYYFTALQAECKGCR